jgi:hypothetical protein
VVDEAVDGAARVEAKVEVKGRPVIVENVPKQNLTSLIGELQEEIRTSRRSPEKVPGRTLRDIARQHIDAPDEIIEWAKRDRRWSFTLAEMLAEPARHPGDLAARLLLAIIDELEEERELADADGQGGAAYGLVHPE